MFWATGTNELAAEMENRRNIHLHLALRSFSAGMWLNLTVNATRLQQHVVGVQHFLQAAHHRRSLVTQPRIALRSVPTREALVPDR
mmetsp:Transcript_66581/g.159128  ORF Transcript_66581/g.159128 Transcript_66581/m.159128 type:complete len:86 (-) Transcript_66581:2706-2963(-)